MGKKKILSIVLASLLLIAVIVSIVIIADNTPTENLPGDNITWYIDKDTKTLYINGTGEMNAVYTEKKTDGSADLIHGAPWTKSEYRDLFDKVVIGEGITNIDRWAFLGLDKIVSVEIPSTVQEIEGQAFAGCTSLTTVNIPSGIKAIREHTFYDCTSLTSIAIPSTVEIIESAAFEGSGLTSVNIPASVKRINIAAFADCAYLTSVTLNEGLEVIESNVFDGTALTSFHIPATVNTIGDSVIRGVPTLATLTVAEGNEVYSTVGNVLLTDGGKTIVAAAGGVSGEYSVPDGVTKIASSAFEGNENITAIDFNAVTEIGVSAFKDCTGILSLNIPATVKTVRTMAFQGCSGIETLTLNNGTESLGKHAFDGCSSVESVEIPASVEMVDDYLFANCSALTTVSIADGISYVGYRAFNKCVLLTDVTLADTITVIGSGAFDSCSGLETITLPRDLVTLQPDAFLHCTLLSDINVAQDSKNYSTDDRAVYGDGGKLLQIYFAAHEGDSYAPLASTVTIAPNAFENAVNLVSIDFSAATALKTISSMAFKGCSALEEIDFPATVKAIGDSAFENCSSLTSIGFAEPDANDDEECVFGANLFKGCNELVSVVVPEGVKSLEGGTFENCTKLVSVDLPSTLTSIGANLFYNCTSLKDVWLPNGIFTINSGTFKNCSSLEEFHIPENIGMFYADVFTGCVNMKKVYIDSEEGWANYCKSNTGNVLADNVGLPLYYCEELYIAGELVTDVVITAESAIPDKNDDIYIPGYVLRGYKGMKTLTIEEGAFDGKTGEALEGRGFTRAASFAFAECTNLEKVTFPSTFNSIGARNFLDCENLKEVNFDGIVSIGINAFDGCTSLRAVVAPKLTTVSGSAFADCTNLKVVDLPAVEKIDKYAFSKCSNMISLHIGPALAAYDSANNPFDGANVYVELVNESDETIGIENTPWYTTSHITKTDDGLWFVESPEEGKYLLGYYGNGAAPEYLYLPKNYNGAAYTVYSGAFANCLNINKVVIPSTVAEIPDGVFAGSSLTAVYASGSTVTNLGLEGKVGNAELNSYVPLSFSGASLSLGNNFAFEYWVSAQALEGFTNPKAVFELNGSITEVTEYTYNENSGNYIFVFKNIAPYMMNDTITAQVVADGISGYSREYSVVQYCNNKLANETTATKLSTLLVDILNYGAKTQAYLISMGDTTVNTALANAGLSADQLAWGSGDTAPAKTNSFAYAETIENPEIAWTGATLELQNSISMRFKFETEKDISALTFKAVDEAGTEFILERVEATGVKDNEYYLYFRGINASMMSDVFEFTVYEGETAVSHTFSYSIESYVYAHQDDGNALAELVIAMMNYGISTDAYTTE